MSTPLQCPICDCMLESSPKERPNSTALMIKCPQCGEYVFGHYDIEGLRNLVASEPTKRLPLIHGVCWLSRDHGPSVLTWDLIRRLMERPLPSRSEQIDKLLLWLGSHFGLGKEVQFESQRFQGIVGSESSEALFLIVKHVLERGLLRGNVDPMRTHWSGYVQMTMAGWDFHDDITRGARGSKRVFMAMQYGEAVLDRIVAEVFTPAVQETGFELVRLDDEPRAGLIDDRLRVEIRRSRFLIADLTHENRGAYWEAGFAEGLGKPVIYTCEKARFEKEKPHFDTNHHLTVPWDPEDPRKTAEGLKATIRATLPDEALQDDPEQTPSGENIA